jgi:hypothetical protein
VVHDGPVSSRHGVVRIVHIDIPPEVEAKIRGKHQVTGDEVREAFLWPARLLACGWENHEVYGWRVIAVGRTYSNRAIVGALDPVDEVQGDWRLRTARSPRSK